MIEKIKYFIRLDIRKKLKLLNKYTKIQFYPSYFPKNGIKSIYTKIILNLFLFNEFKTYKKIFYNSIFNKKNINSKTNFLVSTPSSGSTFLRLMLQSYFELLYKVGDGIPKYDNVNNRMVFAASQIQSADLWNEVKIQNALVDTNKFMSSVFMILSCMWNCILFVRGSIQVLFVKIVSNIAIIVRPIAKVRNLVVSGLPKI